MPKSESYEEFVWSAYAELGRDIVEHLSPEDREFVQRYWGLEDYRPQSFRRLSQVFNLPLSSTYKRYRRIIREIKQHLINYVKTPKIDR